MNDLFDDRLNIKLILHKACLDILQGLMELDDAFLSINNFDISKKHNIICKLDDAKYCFKSAESHILSIPFVLSDKDKI